MAYSQQQFFHIYTKYFVYPLLYYFDYYDHSYNYLISTFHKTISDLFNDLTQLICLLIKLINN